jgi:Lon-like ATP-dependent protease
MQDRKYSIVGQSERSSGAMVRTTSIPCDFILVAAGNMDAIKPTHDHLTGMHPALRSRIRGYGYEVYVNSVMDDSTANRRKLVQFVAQEVKRDGKIPEFRHDAIAEIIREAQRRAGRTGKLTLRLRELGGLVRTAGDVARDTGATVVTADDVRAAKNMSRGLEQQIIERELEQEQRSSGIVTRGLMIGQVTGLVHLASQQVGEPAAMVVPVEAAVTPALSRDTGDIIPGGALATEGGHETLENVGPLLKSLKGADIANVDVHVQAHSKNKDTVLEGLGLAVAIAAVSALDRVPVRQEYAVAGLVTIQGAIRRVEAVTQVVEAAARAGFRHAIVPEGNRTDLQIDPQLANRIEVIFAATLSDALARVLGGEPAPREALLSRIRAAQEAAWVKTR